MDEKKKNQKFIWFLIIISFIGLIYMALFGKAELVPLYLLFTFVMLPFNYFSYSLAKHRNWRYNIWNKRDTYDTEPSQIVIFSAKFTSWLFFCIGLLIALFS
jgi:hypothetical protein